MNIINWTSSCESSRSSAVTERPRDDLCSQLASTVYNTLTSVFYCYRQTQRFVWY